MTTTIGKLWLGGVLVHFFPPPCKLDSIGSSETEEHNLT